MLASSIEGFQDSDPATAAALCGDAAATIPNTKSHAALTEYFGASIARHWRTLKCGHDELASPGYLSACRAHILRPGANCKNSANSALPGGVHVGFEPVVAAGTAAQQAAWFNSPPSFADNVQCSDWFRRASLLSRSGPNTSACNTRRVPCRIMCLSPWYRGTLAGDSSWSHWCCTLADIALTAVAGTGCASAVQ
jgi:hypothetical protein